MNFISLVVQNYALIKYNSQYSSSLFFAWEKENESESIVTKSIESIKDSEVLVVIGYSFPFFNREVDRKIITGMLNLKKVYIQSPDANDIKERFQALREDLNGIEIIPRFDVGQFLLPNEL